MIQRHQLLVLRSMVRNRASRQERRPVTDDHSLDALMYALGYSRNFFNRPVEFHPGQERAWRREQSVIAVIAGKRGGKTAIGKAWLDEQVKLFSNNHIPGSVVTSNLRDNADHADQILARLSEMIFASQCPWQGWERDRRSKRP